MDGMLSTVHAELVAVGAAVAANCEPCLRHHVGKARAAGLTDDQLRAAIGVARAVKETPARLILEAAERLLASAEPAAATAVGAAADRKGGWCG